MDQLRGTARPATAIVDSKHTVSMDSAFYGVPWISGRSIRESLEKSRDIREDVQVVFIELGGELPRCEDNKATSRRSVQDHWACFSDV